ncbi:MAG: histidine kinase dimerization/phosphoacceptor domain -containing protein, partial [Asticcacaulis sp.]
LLAMQARDIDAEEAKASLLLAQQRVYVLSQVHQQLYASGQLASVRIDGLVADLIRNVMSVQMSGSVRGSGVEVALHFVPVSVPADYAVPLAFIATEALVSALETVRDLPSLQISVRLGFDPEGRVRFTLDVPDCQTIQSPDAMPRLISAFCQQLGGEILRPPPFIDLVFDLRE